MKDHLFSVHNLDSYGVDLAKKDYTNKRSVKSNQYKDLTFHQIQKHLWNFVTKYMDEHNSTDEEKQRNVIL